MTKCVITQRLGKAKYTNRCEREDRDQAFHNRLLLLQSDLADRLIAIQIRAAPVISQAADSSTGMLQRQGIYVKEYLRNCQILPLEQSRLIQSVNLLNGMG